MRPSATALRCAVALFAVVAATPLRTAAERVTEPRAQMTFEVIDAPRNTRDLAAIRRMAARPTPDLGALDGPTVIWARVTVTVPEGARPRWYIVVDRGWKYVELHDAKRAFHTGLFVPITDRASPQGRAALPLTLSQGETRTYVMRFSADLDAWEPPHDFIETFEPAAHAELRKQHARLALGLYAGFLIALTFLNLLFGRVLRDTLYIDYVLYAVPYATIWLARDYIFTEALWPETPWVDDIILFAVICASILFGNRFAMRFLGMRESLPKFHRALIGMNVFVGGIIGLALLGQWRHVPDLLGVAALGASVLYIAAGVVVTRRGHSQGRYFAVATGTLAVGTIVYTLWDFGFLPTTPLTEYSAQLGSAIEMALLSFALADRVRQAENERRESEARLRDGLEHEVSVRTIALEEINDTLIELNQQLETQSLTDVLTGVANRRRFDVAIVEEWRRTAREHMPLSVVLVDVDHFKAFNDTHGHLAGDEALRRVARVLANGSKRPGDLLARYGGEEFVLVLPNTDREGAVAHADHLRIAVANAPITDIDGTPLQVTVSMGVAAVRGHTGDLEESAALVMQADEALYRAKSEGRNRVVAS